MYTEPILTGLRVQLEVTRYSLQPQSKPQESNIYILQNKENTALACNTYVVVVVGVVVVVAVVVVVGVVVVVTVVVVVGEVVVVGVVVVVACRW